MDKHPKPLTLGEASARLREACCRAAAEVLRALRLDPSGMERRAAEADESARWWRDRATGM